MSSVSRRTLIVALACSLGGLVALSPIPTRAAPALAAVTANDPLQGLKTLPIDRLIEAVLAHNPTLPAAEYAWQAAQARIDPAGALDDPMLSTSVAPATLGADDIDPGVNIQLSQRLPWPGKRDLRRQAAAQEAAAVRAGIATTRADLIAQTKTAFAEWHLVHAALTINDDSQALWREFRKAATANYAAGRGKRQDVLQADVQVERLEHRRIVLQRQHREVQARLNRLLGRTPEAALPPPGPLPASIAVPDLQTLRQTALAHRNEREALQARLEASQSRVALAKREFYPDLQVAAGYNSMWAREEMRWSVGVSVNLPLDRSKRRSAVSQARAQVMETQARLADLEAGILAAVERAHANVTETAHALALYRQRLLPLAEESFETAQLGYRAGTGDFQALLTSERDLLQTRLNYEQAQADHSRNLAQLERAVGSADAPVMPHGQEAHR